MESRIAKIISALFHPILMPTWGVFTILQLKSYLSYVLSAQAMGLIYATVFLNTALIPMFLSFVLIKMKLVTSITMENQEERKAPYVATGLFYFFCYYLLKQYNLPQTVCSLMLGAGLAVIAALFINSFWKISAHMIGIGGLIGAVTGVGLQMQTDFINILMALVLVSGLVGFARLKLNSHTPAQVYVGFFVGFVLQLYVLLQEVG